MRWSKRSTRDLSMAKEEKRIEKAALPPETAENVEGRVQPKQRSPRKEFREIKDLLEKSLPFYRDALARAEEEQKNRDKEEAQRLFERIEEEHKKAVERDCGLETDLSFLEELKDIAERLSRAAGLERSVSVVAFASDEINAYVYTQTDRGVEMDDEDESAASIYGGDSIKSQYVFLSTGLVRALAEYQHSRGGTVSQDNIAFVLAHEIRHLQQQRSSEITLTSRRKEEYDADIGALEIMGKAGFNPREALESMEFLVSLSKESSPYSLTHPASKSRLIEISKRIADPDIPMHGIGKEPTALSHQPKTESITHALIAEITQHPSPEDMLECLLEQTDTLGDVCRTLPVAAEAMRYSIFDRLADDPRLRSIYVKYLYSIGKRVFEDRQREQQEKQALRAERDALELKQNRSPGEERRLAELRSTVEAKPSDYAFHHAVQGFVDETHDRWGEAWRAVSPDRWTQTIDEDSEADLAAIADRTDLQATGKRGSTTLALWDLPPIDWVSVEQEWEQGAIADTDSARLIELGMEVRRKNHGEHASRMATEEERKKAAHDFAITILDARTSYDQDPKIKGMRTGIEGRVQNEIVGALQPFLERARSLLEGYVSTELAPDVREKVVQYGMCYLFPYAGLKYPEYSYYPNPSEGEEQRAVAEAVLGILPEIYIRTSAVNPLVGHYRPAPVYSVVGSLPDAARDSMLSQMVQATRDRLACMYPDERESLEHLDQYARDPESKKFVNDPLETYRSARAQGVPDDESRRLRQELLNKANVFIWGDEKVFLTFVLCAYGVRDIGEGGVLESAQTLKRAELEALMSALMEDGVAVHVLSRAAGDLLKYNLVSHDDGPSRLYLEALVHSFNMAESNSFKEQQLFSSMVDAEELLHMESATLLSMAPVFGIAIPIDQIRERVEHNTITHAQLNRYIVQCVERREAKQDDTSKDGAVNPRYIGSLMDIAITRLMEECGIPGSNRIGGLEYDPDLKDALSDGVSLQQIITGLPPSEFRNSLLYEHWKRQGCDSNQFERISKHLKKESWSGSNMLSPALQIGHGVAYAQGVPDQAEHFEQRYYQMKRAGTLENGFDLYQFEESGGYTGIMAAAFRANPDLLICPTYSCAENLAVIGERLEKGEFRDYLLVSALKADYFSHTQQAHAIHQSKGVEQMFESDLATMVSEMPALFLDVTGGEIGGDIPPIYRAALIGNIREILPLIESQSLRIALGRLAFELSKDTADTQQSMTSEDEYGLILELFPKPCAARDEYLKSYLLSHSLPLESIREAHVLLSSEHIRGGSSKDEGGFFAKELIRTEAFRLHPERRSQFLLWLMGIIEDPPRELRIAGGMFGVHYDQMREDFSRLTAAEKKEFLSPLLLYENGIFQPETPEGEENMRSFIATLYDNRLALGTEYDPVLKDVISVAIETSLPERRSSLFMSLLSALEDTGGDPLSFDTLLPLLFENAGIFGTKVAQVLSQRDTMPLGTRGEPMSDAMRENLAKSKENAEPFNVIGVVYTLDDCNRSGRVARIDRLLGSASLKQGHLATTREGVSQIEKVRRPAVEKYIDHDIKVLQAICDVLRKHGYRVPTYFVEYISSIVKDEADFSLEVRNQQVLSQSLPSQSRGWNVHVPEVYFVSKDLIEEEVAPGDSIHKLKKENPVLYAEISRITGIELLKGLFQRGIFHADLHDGNIYADVEKKQITFIDAGAVGEVSRAELPVLRKLFKAIVSKDSRAASEYILRLSEKNAPGEQGDQARTILERTLAANVELIFKKNLPLQEIVSHISFEILDYAMPNKSLRYFLKSVMTGAHHLERLKQLSLRDLIEVGPVLASVVFA